MNTLLRAILLALTLLAGGLPVQAQDRNATIGDLEITGAFSRATLPGAPTAGGFLTITNHGSDEDALVSAQSPLAGKVELHQMKMDGDVMKMSRIEGGIAIPAGGTVALEPGGRHLMFMQLVEPFEEGSMVPVLLTFANAGPVSIQLHVGPFNADAPAAMEMDGSH